jgi:hypothetical protein
LKLTIRTIFILLISAFSGVCADQHKLPLTEGFMKDRASGDVCTVRIDQQQVEIELFAQKPIPDGAVQTRTVDWFHHMPRVGVPAWVSTWSRCPYFGAGTLKRSQYMC